MRTLDLYRKLDAVYDILYQDRMGNQSKKIREEWYYYGRIINELITSDEIKASDQIKYRLTDNEDPLKVFNEVTYPLVDKYPELYRLFLYINGCKDMNEFIKRITAKE